MGPRNGRHPKTLPNQAKVAEEQKRCYELRLKGHSIRAIAEIVGLPKSTVHERIEAEIANTVPPLAEQVRQMELDRLDRWLLALEDKIADGDTHAITTAIKVAERRAKYLGIDSAVKVEAQVHEVTQEDLALAEMIREAKARAAVEEARIKESA